MRTQWLKTVSLLLVLILLTGCNVNTGNDVANGLDPSARMTSQMNHILCIGIVQTIKAKYSFTSLTEKISRISQSLAPPGKRWKEAHPFGRAG